MTMKATKVLRLLFFIGCVAFVVQGKSVKWKKGKFQIFNVPTDRKIPYQRIHGIGFFDRVSYS